MSWVTGNRDKNWYPKKKYFVQVVWHEFDVDRALGIYPVFMWMSLYWWIAVYGETDTSLHRMMHALQDK